MEASCHQASLTYQEAIRGILAIQMNETATRNLIHESRSAKHFKCSEKGNLALDERELAYGRYHNLDLAGTLPPRGDYLRYAGILLLQRAGKPLGLNEIATQLDCASEDRLGRLTRYLKKSVEEGYVHESDGRYSLNPRYANSWICFGCVQESHNPRAEVRQVIYSVG